MRVIDFFDKGWALGGAAPLFVSGREGTTSYQEAYDWSQWIGAGLRDAGGGAPHVGILSPNHPLAFMPWLGALRAAGCWVGLNPRYSAAYNTEIINVADVNWLFYHSQFSAHIPSIRAHAPHLKHLVCLDREDGPVPSLSAFVDRYRDRPRKTAPAGNDQAVAIMSTGGTTGKPKGVLQSNLTWETMIASGWHAMPFEGRPVHLLAAPMTHAAGVLAFVLAPSGAVNIILDRVDPLEIMEAIQKHRVTHIFLPPTALYSMLAHPDVRDYDYSSLKYFIIAAAPVAPEKFREAVDVFGPCMCQVFAQAEAPYFLTWLSPREVAAAVRDPALAHRLASCGREFLLTQIEVLDDESRPLPSGQRGEIAVRGNIQMLHYYKNPEATAAIRDADGWQYTGDIGYRDDDGYIYIVDRKKDMIVSGGFNIFSAEVENALNSHPMVRDCAVYGIPDSKWGEAVHATVELKPGVDLPREDLMRFAADRLGSMKAPKSIDFIAALPRSAVGKILKRELRDAWWAGHDRAVG